jgi:hypothetical protein
LINRSRPTKERRTKGDIQAVKEVIYRLLQEEHPMTVRQIFYQLVSLGVIAKTEGEYKSTVVRLLSQMRRSREIPYSWIADNTRWQRKAATWASLKDVLEDTARTYRRSLWDNADAYVEIWLEKDALSGVLWDVTWKWDVPLMVTRGYPSISFLSGAAETIAEKNKPTFLYYLGDYDPSGVDIPRFVEDEIKKLAPYESVYFQRVAVNPEQILELRLPTRPTKQTDSRAKNFLGESVEVDAIPPRRLRQIAEDCITQHIDQGLLERTLKLERLEKVTLRRIARQWSCD